MLADSTLLIFNLLIKSGNFIVSCKYLSDNERECIVTINLAFTVFLIMKIPCNYKKNVSTPNIYMICIYTVRRIFCISY